MTDIIKKTGFQIGLLLGFLLILLSSYIHFREFALVNNVWIGFLTLILTVIFGIISILILKNKFGGLISFKDSFSVYFITILTGSLLACAYLTVLYYFIISPETKETIKQIMIDSGINTMKQNLATQKEINEAIEMSKTSDPFTINEVVSGHLKYLLRDSLIGFLVALIFRNKRTL